MGAFVIFDNTCHNFAETTKEAGKIKNGTSDVEVPFPLLYSNLSNRDGGIRTRDPLNPIQVRYRTALRPVRNPARG